MMTYHLPNLELALLDEPFVGAFVVVFVPCFLCDESLQDKIAFPHTNESDTQCSPLEQLFGGGDMDDVEGLLPGDALGAPEPLDNLFEADLSLHLQIGRPCVAFVVRCRAHSSAARGHALPRRAARGWCLAVCPARADRGGGVGWFLLLLGVEKARRALGGARVIKGVKGVAQLSPAGAPPTQHRGS